MPAGRENAKEEKSRPTTPHPAVNKKRRRRGVYSETWYNLGKGGLKKKKKSARKFQDGRRAFFCTGQRSVQGGRSLSLVYIHFRDGGIFSPLEERGDFHGNGEGVFVRTNGRRGERKKMGGDFIRGGAAGKKGGLAQRVKPPLLSLFHFFSTCTHSRSLFFRRTLGLKVCVCARASVDVLCIVKLYCFCTYF